MFHAYSNKLIIIVKSPLLLLLVFVVLTGARLPGKGQLGIPQGQGEPG